MRDEKAISPSMELMYNKINDRRSVEKEDFGQMQQCTQLEKKHVEIAPSKVLTPVDFVEGMQFHVPSNIHLFDDTNTFQPLVLILKGVLGSSFVPMNESGLGPI